MPFVTISLIEIFPRSTPSLIRRNFAERFGSGYRDLNTGSLSIVLCFVCIWKRVARIPCSWLLKTTANAVQIFNPSSAIRSWNGKRLHIILPLTFELCSSGWHPRKFDRSTGWVLADRLTRYFCSDRKMCGPIEDLGIVY